jgi:hypothetical protein
MKIRFEKVEIEVDEALVGKVGNILLSLAEERNRGDKESASAHNDWLLNLVREALPTLGEIFGMSVGEPASAPVDPAQPVSVDSEPHVPLY